MSNYTKTTNFTAKDALTTGDPNKVIKGSDQDTEFDNIATSSATKANKVVSGTTNAIIKQSAGGDLEDSGLIVPTGAVVGISDTQTLTNKSIDSDTNTITNLVDADIKAAAGIAVTKVQHLTTVTSDVQTQIDTKLTASNNLSDIVTASTARTNLGLGTLAVKSSVASTDLATGLGAWVEISRSTASASTNIEITTGIDATYKQYMVAFEGVVPATTGVYLQMQVGTGATPTWFTAATNYIYVNDLTASGTLTAFIRLSGSVVNTLTEGGTHGFLTFNDPSSATIRQRFSFDTNSSISGGLQRIVGAGQLRDTGAVTALRFYMSTGNIAVGDFVLYGLSN